MTVTLDKEPPSAPTDPSPSRRPTARVVPTVLVALIVAFLVAGIVFLVRAGSVDDSAATSNEALINRSETTEVVSQVSTALNQILTYDSAKPQASAAAAKKWLTGDAPKQYQRLVADLKANLGNQQLTLVAKVTSAGVKTLRGDRAQLLVFLDQRSTRVSDGQSVVGAAMVQIAARRDENTWQIYQLKPL